MKSKDELRDLDVNQCVDAIDVSTTQMEEEML